MNDTELIDVEIKPLPKTKWEREYAAFRQMLPDLMKEYKGRYVAIHDGRIVATGDDEVKVIEAAYDKVEYVAMHVGLVTNEPPRVVRIRSPRAYRG